MPSKDLGIRFTEEKYATKSEAAKELGISIVDNLWVTVLKYREQHKRILNIRSVDNTKLTYCLCPAVYRICIRVCFRNLFWISCRCVSVGYQPGNTETENRLCGIIVDIGDSIFMVFLCVI